MENCDFLQFIFLVGYQLLLWFVIKKKAGRFLMFFNFSTRLRPLKKIILSWIGDEKISGNIFQLIKRFFTFPCLEQNTGALITLCWSKVGKSSTGNTERFIFYCAIVIVYFQK